MVAHWQRVEAAKSALFTLRASSIPREAGYTRLASMAEFSVSTMLATKNLTLLSK